MRLKSVPTGMVIGARRAIRVVRALQSSNFWFHAYTSWHSVCAANCVPSLLLAAHKPHICRHCVCPPHILTLSDCDGVERPAHDQFISVLLKGWAFLLPPLCKKSMFLSAEASCTLMIFSCGIWDWVARFVVTRKSIVISNWSCNKFYCYCYIEM